MQKRRKLTRRLFLSEAGVLGASALAAEAAPSAFVAKNQNATRSSNERSSFLDFLRPPDSVTVHEGAKQTVLKKGSGASWSGNGITVLGEFSANADHVRQLNLSLIAPKQPLSRIHLRWQTRVPSGLRFLGDHWERSYGDLEWRGLIGERVMPWYFLTHDGERTHGYGVATGASAMAFWRVDNSGVSLWLDVRNGGSPVLLGERTLELCTVITREGHENETPWQAARSFCALLCSNPRLPKEPVYGGNNWYYAYGENCSAKAIERDAGLLAELTGGNKNRAFQVIDEGWELVNWGAGPWRYGNAAFPDMPGLASKLKATGVRPGIWMRPLLTRERGLDSWTIKKPGGGDDAPLDPTIPEVRERIRSDVAGLVAWGYELVKHDFSSADIFGRWGSRMGSSLTGDGWSFHDRSRTTAEVVRDFYQAIREGAGERTVVIGCNTVGHLGAGLFELQRVGDDTSGKEWDRTRRMGVNALAFRGVQHGSFFATDADCVGIMNAIPWELNKQWLDLLSRSGTPLFVSAAPDALGTEQRKALRQAFGRAAAAHPVAEPLDWMETTTPEKWKCDGETITYDWYGTTGDTGE